MSSERLRSHAHLLLTHLLWMNWRSLLHVGSRQHRFLVFCLLVGMAKCHRAGGNWRSKDTEIFERNVEVFFLKKANLRRKITHSDVLAMFDAPYFVDADIAAGEAVAVVAVQSHIVVLDVFRRNEQHVKTHKNSISSKPTHLQPMHSHFSCEYKSMCESR